MTPRILLSTMLALGLTAFAHAEQGNPNLKSIDAINFGPNAQLLIGSGTQVVTVDTGDTKAITWSKTEIANVGQLLAGKLGVGAKDIEIKRLAVNPVSRKAYVVVRNLKAKQDVIVTVDGDGTIAEFALDNVKYNRYPLAVGDKAVTKVTDVIWAGGKIVAATQAGDTFGSRVFSILPGEKGNSPLRVSFSTETYHVGHGKWETKAPILCMMPYEEDGKTSVVGSFTCTPIVKYPLQDMEPSGKIKGVSVIELGTGNKPRSMFAYEKDGKKFILVNAFRHYFNEKNPVGPSPYWVVRVDFDLLKETVNVNEKALWRVKAKASESLTDRAAVAKEYFGVQHMAKLDASRALVVQTAAKGGLQLRVLNLP